MKRTSISTMHILGIVLTAAAALLCASSCGPKSNSSTSQRSLEGLISVKYEDLKQGEDILISEWVGEPEFIALDSRPEAVTNGMTQTISDNYIGIYGKGTETVFKLFDRASGSYLRDIGGIGRGPGEYLSISSAQIDEAGGKVWISTLETNKIYCYDIGTGRLIADIKLPYKAENNSNNGYNFVVDSLSETITVAPLPFKDKCPAAVWCQDFEGNIIWEIPEAYTLEENVLLTMQTYNNIPGTMDLCFNSNNTIQDTIYVVEDRELRPLLAVQFEGVTEPGHIDFSEDKIFRQPVLLPDYAVIKLSKIAGMTSKGPEYILDYEYLPSVVLDRKTGQVGLHNIVNDIMAWSDDDFTFSNGYLVRSFDAMTFKEAGSKALTDGTLSDTARERITAILSGLSDNSNNILMIAPLK